MDEIEITQVTIDELDRIIQDAVKAAIPEQPAPPAPKTIIKGIHELASFLGVSPSRAQKLKNDGVFPYFQDGRLVLFDPKKVREAMAVYNQSHQRKKKS
jgi:hypothetical protein